ncbi:hypothetical protein NDU88_004992 [Pleurodeles waltl]|uniref:Palmitoyl-protein thioesterase ABHD10, mitochondrial n=1 Tax=Pleurodeles waltl TaxID=8319 RepID=A0AAV7NMN9_PLEWA|nr:hypothetical protein NDU88_004992 [Pleurodeles waltl]
MDSQAAQIAGGGRQISVMGPERWKNPGQADIDFMSHLWAIYHKGQFKATVQFLTRPDLPKLAYQKIKGKNPGVIFLPGYASNMNGQKAVALEDFCNSLGHSFVRFDYTGCGSSEGDIKECTVGRWKKDVLSVLDELSEGPQILVGSSLGGWLMLLAAIARPEKVAALVGVAAAADHVVTSFNQLTVEGTGRLLGIILNIMTLKRSPSEYP